MALNNAAQKIALVTGGSRGIGAATCTQLASQGYDLCIAYRANDAAAQQLAGDLSKQGVRVVLRRTDISVSAEVSSLFAFCDERLGPLTALVNNAGVVAPKARVDETTEARLQTLFSTNVYGSVYCCREAVLRMSTRHGGRGGAIVNLSSAASRHGAAGEYVDYAATKGAIDTFTSGLAKEVATEGIRVNAVRPGVIDTEIHASGGQPDRVAQFASQIPMARAGTADEVAGAIVWLLSDQAAYTTGAILDVAGGR